MSSCPLPTASHAGNSDEPGHYYDENDYYLLGRSFWLYNGHFEGVCHEDDHDNHNDADNKVVPFCPSQ